MEKKGIVKRANNVRKILTGDFNQVRQIVNAHDLVWGVWQGGDMMIVKGEPMLRFIAKSGVEEEINWTAIPCTCAEQAMALKLAVEDGTIARG